VPVPRHWCQKRKFLQNKRGILKTPFKLPEYIEATGISKLRDPFTDRDGSRMIKQKLRERMNPKLGKIDIDYEVLHDAFFKHQIKPKMTIHGDTYFEGKEDEVKMRSYKPGKISDDLRSALGISEYSPPPWLISMQRFGPPPSYPHLKIPGLNTSLSDSQYFYFSKHNQDEAISKLIGNLNPNFKSNVSGIGGSGGLFGNHMGNSNNNDLMYIEENVDKAFWGKMNECDDEDELLSQAGIENEISRNTESIDYTDRNKTGVSSMVSGMDTPGFMDMSKGNTNSMNTDDTEDLAYNDTYNNAPERP